MSIKYTLSNIMKDAPSGLLEKIGPARFSAADQADAPSEPRTRVVKDVLHVGEWKVGPPDTPGGKPKLWKVTVSTLEQLAKSYNKAHELGLSSSLYWGSPSGSTNQHDVEARYAICPIDQLVVDGERLYAVCYVNEYTYNELRNPSMKVSLHAMQDYVDGRARVWDWMLLHVAIVDHPVVDSQSPFISLANEQDDEVTSESEANDAKVISDLRVIINDMLGLIGVEPVESGIPNNDLVIVLRTKVATLIELSPEASKKEGETVPEEAKKTEDVSLSNDLGQKILDQVVSLSNRIDQIEKDRATEAQKGAYQGELNRLFTEGRIDAATKGEYEKVGQSVEYSLSLLKPLGTLSLSNSQNTARRLATGQAPSDVGGEVQNPADATQTMPAARSAEQVAKDIAERYRKK